MKKILILALLVILLASATVMTVAAGGSKVTLCHRSQAADGAGVTIEVSENAESAHVAHGDLQGSCADTQNTCPIGPLFFPLDVGHTVTLSIDYPVGRWFFDMGPYGDNPEPILIEGPWGSSESVGAQGLYDNAEQFTDIYSLTNITADPIVVYFACFE